MIAYNTVLRNRAKLIEHAQKPCLTSDEVTQLSAETVKCYENDQLLFDELVHYDEHGEILGNHPIFKEDKLLQQINLLSPVEAFKRYKNLASKISREKRKLKSAKNKSAKEKMQFFINDLENERQLLKQRANGQSVI